VGRSFKLGVIRLTERFVTSDPLASRDERKMVQFINRLLEDHAAQILTAGFDRVIGTSGTILSLGTMAAHAESGHAPGEIRNLRIPARQIHRLRKQVVSLGLQQRLKLPGLEPRRSDIVVAGAVLLDTILRRLAATDITLCDLALREGLVLDYINRNRRQIAQADRYPDVRRRSVMELAERCNYSPEHAQQIARLAVSLFDQTRGVHGLGDLERDWLEYAALMHDLGVHISYEKHHRHSYYLVKNGDLRGFEPQEIEVMALVTRYHRRAVPRKAHEGYGGLPGSLRRTVRALSAILRLAEGLDRSHSQPLSAVDLHDRGEDALIQLRTSGDAELELWAAHRHVIPFERMLGKPVRFEIRGTTPHAEHAH
jgi:exopolyphosphatase / guanosine-5'-triphosphate,3'-diphosphate pyrophosphatase